MCVPYVRGQKGLPCLFFYLSLSLSLSLSFSLSLFLSHSLSLSLSQEDISVTALKGFLAYSISADEMNTACHFQFCSKFPFSPLMCAVTKGNSSACKSFTIDPKSTPVHLTRMNCAWVLKQ